MGEDNADATIPEPVCSPQHMLRWHSKMKICIDSSASYNGGDIGAIKIIQLDHYGVIPKESGSTTVPSNRSMTTLLVAT